MRNVSAQFPVIRLAFLALILVINGLQSQSIFSGFGLEVGGGHDQLFWSSPAQVFGPNTNTTANRTDLSFTPTIRLNYRWQADPTIFVTPFIAYDRFGGKEKLDNGYQDQFWFDALECGAFGSYALNSFSAGIGLKASYCLKATARYFGSANQTSSANAAWGESDLSEWFTKWSGDAGARVSYQYDHYSLSLESWFGVTQLQSGIISPAKIRENHYRVLVGYTL